MSGIEGLVNQAVDFLLSGGIPRARRQELHHPLQGVRFDSLEESVLLEQALLTRSLEEGQHRGTHRFGRDLGSDRFHNLGLC